MYVLDGIVFGTMIVAEIVMIPYYELHYAYCRALERHKQYYKK